MRSTYRSCTSAIVFVYDHATSRFCPITTAGKPGIEPPCISMSGEDSSTAYQVSGIVEVMCGSPASSGLPVTERSPDTTQLFDPAAWVPMPIASRTWAIWAASASPSPDQGVAGCVTTGWPSG